MPPKRKPRGAAKKAIEQEHDVDQTLSQEYLDRRQKLIAELESQGMCMSRNIPFEEASGLQQTEGSDN